jgi:hypothetical protein
VRVPDVRLRVERARTGRAGRSAGPTNGSAVVLNTRTRSGPVSSAATSTVAPDLSVGLDRRPRRRGGEVARRTRRAGRAGRSP